MRPCLRRLCEVPCAPRQALQHRSDTKMYRIQSPQTPLVRTQRYGEYHMDEFPSGTNMIVAVLAYTGPLLVLGSSCSDG